MASFFLSPASSSKSLEWIFYTLLGSLLPLMLTLSFDFGITWDEPDLTLLGQLNLHSYQLGLTDKYADYESYRLKGGLFELACIFFHKVFPSIDFYDTRHLLNSFLGWLGILFTGLLAKRLFGTFAGILAVLFMVMSPRYFGHSMNNPKDIPFAAFYIMSIYYLSHIQLKFPYVTGGTLIKIMLSIALALNIRVGGLLLIAYTAVFLGGLVLFDQSCRSAKQIIQVTFVFTMCSLSTIVLGTVFWPWALANPLVRPFIALREVTHFPAAVYFRSTLFNGDWVAIDQLPWDYIFRWFFITTPLGALIGVLAPFLLFKHRNSIKIFALIFTVIFPILYVVFRNSTLYDGMRHLLFVYPPFIVLAAGLWSQLFQKLSHKRFGTLLATGALMISFYHPIKFHFVNHPHQVVYFNQFSGGLQGAFKKYELDYWGNCYKPAIDWLHQLSLKEERPLNIGATIAHIIPWVYTERYPNLNFIGQSQQGDFYIDLLRGSPSMIEAFLREGSIVHQIQANAVPLCLIKKGKGNLVKNGKLEEGIGHDRQALRSNPSHAKVYNNLGIALSSRGQFEEAIGHFRQALRINPVYAEAHNNLGKALASRGEIEVAIDHFRQALRIDPIYAEAYNNLGIALSSRGEIEEAIDHFRQALRIDPIYAEAHNNLGKALSSRGEFEEAIDHFREALHIEPEFVEAHQSLGRVLAHQGKRDEAVRHYEEALRIMKVRPEASASR